MSQRASFNGLYKSWKRLCPRWDKQKHCFPIMWAGHLLCQPEVGAVSDVSGVRYFRPFGVNFMASLSVTDWYEDVTTCLIIRCPAYISQIRHRAHTDHRLPGRGLRTRTLTEEPAEEVGAIVTTSTSRRLCQAVSETAFQVSPPRTAVVQVVCDVPKC